MKSLKSLLVLMLVSSGIQAQALVIDKLDGECIAERRVDGALVTEKIELQIKHFHFGILAIGRGTDGATVTIHEDYKLGGNRVILSLSHHVDGVISSTSTKGNSNPDQPNLVSVKANLDGYKKDELNPPIGLKKVSGLSCDLSLIVN